MILSGLVGGSVPWEVTEILRFQKPMLNPVLLSPTLHLSPTFSLPMDQDVALSRVSCSLP